MARSSNHTMKLSLREVKCLLFKSKKCKICGKKLEKVTEKEDLGEKSIYTGGTFYKGKTIEHKIRYYCKECDKIFELLEL